MAVSQFLLKLSIIIYNLFSLYPLLKVMLLVLIPPPVKNAGYEHAKMAREKSEKRMELDDRSELMNKLFKKREEWVSNTVFMTGESSLLAFEL
jgi:hypothetical protein